MTDELKRLLENNLYVLGTLHKRGDLDDASYYKGIVCVAYEYAINDSLTTAVSLLSGVPEQYYKGTQPEQLVQDAAYWEVAEKLALLVVKAGFAGLESDDVRPTQPPATA